MHKTTKSAGKIHCIFIHNISNKIYKLINKLKEKRKRKKPVSELTNLRMLNSDDPSLKLQSKPVSPFEA